MESSKYLFTCRDVTELKQAEESLRASEALLHASLDGLTSNIAIIDESGTILLVNNAWRNFAEQNGVSPDLVSEGINYYEICLNASGECSEGAREFTKGIKMYLIRKFRNSPSSIHAILQIEQRWFIARASIVSNFDPPRIIIAHQNITDQKKAEEKIRESEQRFRMIYTTTPAMLHSIDCDGRLISVSNYWLEKMGYSREEVIGRKSTEFLTDKSREVALKYFPLLFKQGYIRDMKYQFIRKDGSIIDVLLSGTAEYDTKGKFLRARAVINDITSLTNAEKELTLAKDEVDQKAARLEELNTALKVLIEKRDEEKLELENRILTNINTLVKPYFEKLKRISMDNQQELLISIIESNCREITEPLIKGAQKIHGYLSPVELQVADLIRMAGLPRKYRMCLILQKVPFSRIAKASEENLVCWEKR